MVIGSAVPRFGRLVADLLGDQSDELDKTSLEQVESRQGGTMHVEPQEADFSQFRRTLKVGTS